MLLDVRDAHADFVSLQKGPGPDDMILLASRNPRPDLGSHRFCRDSGAGQWPRPRRRPKDCQFPRSRKLARAIDSVPSRDARAPCRGNNDDRAHDALQRREFGTNRKRQAKTGICVKNCGHARVFFVQHPSRNALWRGFPRGSFVACARSFGNLTARRRGASRSRPVFKSCRLRPSRSAGVSEGAMRLKRGPRGQGNQP